MSATSLVFFSRFFSPSTAPSTNNTHEQKLGKWDISGRDLKKYANCQITMCLKIQKSGQKWKTLAIVCPICCNCHTLCLMAGVVKFNFQIGGDTANGPSWWVHWENVFIDIFRRVIFYCAEIFFGGEGVFPQEGPYTMCITHSEASASPPGNQIWRTMFGKKGFDSRLNVAARNQAPFLYFICQYIKECLIDQSWGLCSHSQRRRILQHSLRQMLWPWWRHQGTEWLIRITDLITY